MRRVLALAIVIGILAITSIPAHAQQAAPVSTNPAFITFQEKYFADLSRYREMEETFEVTRAQYYQLNTLASQEQVLKEARELFALRAEVLQTYLHMLSLVFEETNGIPLEQKFAISVSLAQLIDQLALHRNDILQVSTRAEMDKESEEFINLYEDISEQSYFALSYIKLGRVQVAFDKLRIIRDKVKTEVYSRTLTPAQLAQKDRGFGEIQGLIDTISSKLRVAEERIRRGQTTSLNGYTNLNQQLSPIFSQTNQTIEFLQEIR